ncbi:MAG: hypothetical protein ACE37F_10345 [Nannocystaceae bacterium]|nr:hypothetical protein [bacterium]
MPRHAHLALAAAMSSMSSMVGCGMGLPLEERIAGLRPLAIRVEVDDPAAAGDDPVRAESLPFERVRVVPFIVDVEGPLGLPEVASELEPRWIACNLAPIEGVGSCLANLAPLTPSDVPECPPVDFTALDPSDPDAELPTFPSPCELTEGTASQPEFVVPFDPVYLFGGDIEITMVAHLPGEGDTDRCLEQLLAGGTRSDASCLFAAQRASVGPDTVLIDLASQFGIPDLEGTDALPDPLPEADTHPRIQSFVVRELDESGEEVAVFSPMRGEVIEVAAGHQLDLETLAPEGDLQTFPIQTEDGFTEEQESYSGAWFTTWGVLLSAGSDDPLSLNAWSLVRGEQDEEGDVPPGNRATLFYVLRDGRGGVDWWWFHADVIP